MSLLYFDFLGQRMSVALVSVDAHLTCLPWCSRGWLGLEGFHEASGGGDVCGCPPAQAQRRVRRLAERN